MPDPRPNLNDIRTNYQVRDDEVISYSPTILGIPLTEGRQMTKTEGALLDRLQFDKGLLGLSEFRDIATDAFSTATARFPDNKVPANIPADQAANWQGNDGHRDAFRHAYWSARLTQEYGENWAKAFTTAHEGLPGNFANREAMDLYNNSVGIKIATENPNAKPEQLANLIQQAVTQGKTVVMDSSGNLQWSDRVPVGQHGMSPEDVIGPKLKTPGVVSTNSMASLDTPTNGQGVALAAANVGTNAPTNGDASRNVDAMLRDPLYAQIQQTMQNKGLEGDVLAANLYASAKGKQMEAVTDIQVGNPITNANGNPDRNYFVFDGKTSPAGPNFAMVSENEVRGGTVQDAAKKAAESPVHETLALNQPEPKKAMTV